MDNETKIYKCHKCGVTHENSSNFRELVGNVLIPDKGGLVGQNIFSKSYDRYPVAKQGNKAELSIIAKGRTPITTGTDAVNIYSSILCVSCYLEVSHITPEGENTL